MAAVGLRSGLGISMVLLAWITGSPFRAGTYLETYFRRVREWAESVWRF